MQHPQPGTTVRQPKNQLKRSILSGCGIKKAAWHSPRFAAKWKRFNVEPSNRN